MRSPVLATSPIMDRTVMPPKGSPGPYRSALSSSLPSSSSDTDGRPNVGPGQGLWIEARGIHLVGVQVRCEVANDLVSPSASLDRESRRGTGEGERQRLRQGSRVALFASELIELGEDLCLLELEPQPATEANVFGETQGKTAPEGLHATPPGNGRATSVREVVATFV